MTALNATTVRVGKGATVASTIAKLRGQGLVASAEPNWRWTLPKKPAKVKKTAAGQAVSPLNRRPAAPTFGALTDMPPWTSTGENLVAPADSSLAWGQRKIGMDAVWRKLRGDSRVIVAVLDTGVDLNHPDLRPVLVPGYSTYNEAGPNDYEGHGTHVAGVIAGIAQGDPGVKGVAYGCRVMPVKVMGPTGTGGSVENVAAGIVWAVDNGARVINMSLGDEGSSTLLRDAVAYAQAHDVLIVAASGNLDESRHTTCNTINYPAAYPGVMAVGATDSEDQLAYFSFWGHWLSVVAPGVDIVSSVPGDGSATGNYRSEQGTSMASPFVAGLAAMVRSQHPDWKAAQIKAHIEATAVDLGEPGLDQQFGHGRIDAAKALLAN